MNHALKLLEKHWIIVAVVLFVAVIAMRTASSVEPQASSDTGDDNGA